MIKTLCIGAATAYAATRLFNRFYAPTVRRQIQEPFTAYRQRELYTSAVLSKLAYDENICMSDTKQIHSQWRLHPGMKPISFHEDLEADAQAYIWHDMEVNVTHVVFRGTEHERDVLADLDVRTVHETEWDKINAHMRVHKGFCRQFMSIKASLWADLAKSNHRRVVFSGHSLGAALATIASLFYAIENENNGKIVECYTIGSPRVGNHAFASEFSKHVSNHCRIFNENDVVAMIPISSRFCHVDNGLCIDDSGNFYSVAKDDPWFLRMFVSLADLDVESDHRSRL